MPGFQSREQTPAHLRPDNTVDALEELAGFEEMAENSVAQDEMKGALGAMSSAPDVEISENDSGPFENDMLNAALAESFGMSLDGVGVNWAADEDASELDAVAFTEGSDVSFSGETSESLSDPESLDTIAHEMAHALAGGGSGEVAVDEAGDQGEATADKAGAQFAQWGKQGFSGEAPKLQAATGGRASVHRKAKAKAPTVLREGSRGSRVTQVQRRLRVHGFKVSADGDFGPATESAVRSFQKKKGLSADGVVGPKTFAALNRAAAKAPSKKPKAPAKPATKKVKVTGSPPMRRGSRGNQVKALQKLLRIRADGDFGGGTDSAVRAFQRRKGLLADGVVGPTTARVLNGGKPPAGGSLRYMTGNGGRRLGLVRRQNEWMLPRTAAAFDRLASAARRDGVRLVIKDGFRSYQEQVYLARTLGLYSQGGLAAYPGTSNHGLGVALDLWDGRNYSWLLRNAPRAGFRRTVPREAWHWEV